jgi:hypothetical protein
MVATSSRRPRAAISKETIDRLNEQLQQLPEKNKEDLSLREAVEQIRGQLEAALAKGYSYEELTALLVDQNIVISPATLKRYVPTRTRRSRKAATEPKQRRTRNKQQDATESAPSQDASAAKPARGRRAAQTKAAPEAKTEASTTKRRSAKTKESTPTRSTARTTGRGRRRSAT